MSTTQGSSKRARTEGKFGSDKAVNSILPDGFVFSDRLQRRSVIFSWLVKRGVIKEVEIVAGHTPKSLMELVEAVRYVEGCYPSVQSTVVHVNEGAYIYVDELDILDDEIQIVLHLFEHKIRIGSDDDEAARRAMTFILDLHRHEDDDSLQVSIEPNIILDPDCLRSLFHNPNTTVRFVNAELSSETCALIFANGNRLCFDFCHFDDDGKAMMEALDYRSNPEIIVVRIVLCQSELPMSDHNFQALLDRKGKDPLGGISIGTATITETWADAMANANVKKLGLFGDCVGADFSEKLARSQAVGIGPTTIEVEIGVTCHVAFFRGLEDNHHLTSLTLYFVDIEYTGWEALCHSLARNKSLKDLKLALVPNKTEVPGHLLNSISHNTSINSITILNSNMTIPWLCTQATALLTTNRVIEEFIIVDSEDYCFSLFEKVVHGDTKYCSFQKAVAPFLARNVMYKRIQALKDTNATPALVGAALAKVGSAKEVNRIDLSLLWQLLSEYSSLVASLRS